ncbi:MAG TPA: hypothetical protein VF787_19460 [Thermoanaerobaculia bacterium]
MSRNPLPEVAVGDVLRVHGKKVLVRKVTTCVTRRENVVEHMTIVATRAIKRKQKKRIARNVVRMPAGDHSVVGQFIRYHVLVRVYDGDPDAWLAQLRERSGEAEIGGDIRFVHWIRSRLRQDPTLLASIRRMVDATPFWRAAALR